MASPRPARFIHIEGTLPPELGHLALPPLPLETVLLWVDEHKLGPEYYYILLELPVSSRVKGGPGANPVRTPNKPVVARYANNARFRRVAMATYPTMTDPAAAVRRWYVYGGSTQVLRWSDAQVDGYIRELNSQVAKARGTGNAWIYTGNPDPAEARKRARIRERGEPGSPKRAASNARRAAQRRAARLRKRRSLQVDTTAVDALSVLSETFGQIEEVMEGFWT